MNGRRYISLEVLFSRYLYIITNERVHQRKHQTWVLNVKTIEKKNGKLDNSSCHNARCSVLQHRDCEFWVILSIKRNDRIWIRLPKSTQLLHLKDHTLLLNNLYIYLYIEGILPKIYKETHESLISISDLSFCQKGITKKLLKVPIGRCILTYFDLSTQAIFPVSLNLKRP